MHASDRALRQEADRLHTPVRWTSFSELATKERIRNVGRTLLARHGLAALPTTRLARALNVQTATFRRHAIDAEALAADVITGELAYLEKAFAAVPADTPDRAATLRALWHAEAASGPHAEARRLILRDLAVLPDDLREPLERTFAALTAAMAGPLAEKFVALLRTGAFTPEEMETVLASLATAPAQMAPARTPAPAPIPQARREGPTADEVAAAYHALRRNPPPRPGALRPPGNPGGAAQPGGARERTGNAHLPTGPTPATRVAAE